MIDNSFVCTDERLLALLHADEGSDVALQIARHVEQCHECQQRLEELAANDDDWIEAGELLAAHARTAADFQSTSGKRWTASRFNARSVAWTESMARQLLSAPSHPEMMGRIGRYDVERLIGSGGMGVVFKAYDTELNRPVAVKLLVPYLASSGAARNRFAREARAAAAVVDDHVVPIYNVETEDEHPFLVMKYIAGGSLQQRLDREGPLEVCEVLSIGMQTAKGLAAAHAQGLIHRDVKPSNILLDEGVERALLTDFGLARATDDASLTRSGFHPGTPHYMSPEQVRGEAIDARSDLFGLGCVLYALCTGHPPFRSETSYAVLRRITDDTPRPIRETNPDVPAWLEQIVLKLLAKSPDERFDSAGDVAELLEDCLAHVQQPTTTPLPESIAALAPEQNRRPPIGKFIAAAAFAFSLIFAGVLIVLELNKGTLMIESDVDDIPIRITQGTADIDSLMVTRTGASVRVAAGSYIVEIDGEFEGITLNKKVVSLKRGGKESVKIVRTDEMATRPQDNDAEAVARAKLSEQAARQSAHAAFALSELNARGAQHELDKHANGSSNDSRNENPEVEPDAVEGAQVTESDVAVRPRIGELILLSLTGDVAKEYAKQIGTIRRGKPADDLEIETTTSVAQRLNDGRVRIEHHSTPVMVHGQGHIVFLTATVDPTAFVSETIPSETAVKASPSATVEAVTSRKTQSWRLALSDLDEVIIKRFITPLPARAAALLELQFKRTAPALQRLLELNGDATSHIEKLGHPTDSAGIKDVEEIHSAGQDYIAVVARRYPPGIEQPFGQEGIGISFVFDKLGNLLARFGGEVGPDGVNGDEVQLLTLGTDDQWFAVVRRFEKHGEFKHRSDVFLIEDGFPLAFRNYEQKSMAWTSQPDPEHPGESPYFFNPGGLQSRALGKGKDGNEHLLIFGWDSAKRMFRGLSEITHSGEVLFRVDMNKSTKFEATDRSKDDVAGSGPVAVVMLMHPGELPSGNTIQRTAATKAFGLLAANDYCGILRYGKSGPEWLWCDGKTLTAIGKQRDERLAAIAASHTGDFPTFDPAFVMAIEAMKNVKASQKRLIVFTDGDPVFANESVIAEFREAGIKVTVIHVDVHQLKEVPALRRLTDATGGSYHYALAPQAGVVERLFEREIKSLRADRTTSLRKLGIAFLNRLHDKPGSFPGSRMTHLDRHNKDFEHPFSWRVAILPYIGQQRLFDEYRFDEPWDSENNRSLLTKMPDIYRSPHATVEQPPGYANMLGFATQHGALGLGSGEAISSFSDGTSKTILIVETQHSVPWTKPEDLTQSTFELFADQPLRFVLADGSVDEMYPVNATELEKMITRDGGEILK